VCSNSLRGAALTNAVGLLKEELRRAGSLVLACADQAAVPAGGALAVDRDQFSALVTERIAAHPRITLLREEVTTLPSERPLILATGPLTSEPLAAALAAVLGHDALAYYDAIAPIVAADSIDLEQGLPRVALRQRRRRRQRGLRELPDERGRSTTPSCGRPRRRGEGRAAGLRRGAYFEGCLPVRGDGRARPR
jgi:methylenetetrahydrofolate--tRNA-(uracil-5-)-methyltransferase